MKRNYPFIAALCLIAVAIVACSSNRKQAVNEDGAQEAIPASVVVPAFNADSAYRYVKEQVDFGPRVPNTAAHRACGDYLIGKLKQFGATVHVQEADLVAYDNTILKARNIIGSFNPDNRRRVLLCAHWDSRPYADSERSKKKQREPILGANDGASGVGVLLEMARLMQQQAPAIGVDIIFFDAEDYGIPTFYKGNYKADTHLVPRLAILGPRAPRAGLQRPLRHPAGHGGRTGGNLLPRRLLPAHCPYTGEEDLGHCPTPGIRLFLPPGRRHGGDRRPHLRLQPDAHPLRGHHQLRPECRQWFRGLLAYAR